MLEKEKNKATTGEKMSKTKAKAFEKSNKGVELRSKKDIESLPSNPVNIQAKLEEKAKQYEALMRGEKDKKGLYLVDFAQKKFDNMTEKEKEEFEKEKEMFYEEQQRLLREREESIINRNKAGELAKNLERQEAERLGWEAEALREIREGITEEMKQQQQERVLVKQSYDRRITEQGKELLAQVIKEQSEEKSQANEIKRKRQEILDLRKEKLRKLNTQLKPDENNASKPSEGSGNN